MVLECWVLELGQEWEIQTGDLILFYGSKYLRNSKLPSDLQE